MQMPPKERYKSGLTAFKNKQYKEAIHHFSQLAEIEPNNEAYYWLGNAYMMKKDDNMGIHYLQMAKDYQPTGQETYCNKRKNYTGDSLFYLAKITNHCGDRLKALDFIDEAIQQDGNNPYYHILKGCFCFKEHQFKEAIQSYEAVITIFNDILKKKNQDPEKHVAAIQKYQSLLIRYYGKLADMLTQVKTPKKETKDNYIKLARCYNNLAHLQPEKKVDYLIKIARLCEAIDELGEAILAWGRVFETQLITPELCYEAFLVCNKRVKQVEKVEHIKTKDDTIRDRFHEMDVNALIKQHTITDLRTLERRYLQAAYNLENVSSTTENGRIHCKLAKDFYSRVQAISDDKIVREKRLISYENYLARYPNNKDGLYYLGNLYYLDEVRNEAITTFLKVLKIDRNHIPTHNSLLETLKTLKPEDDLSQVDMEALYAVIKLYPEQQKCRLAKAFLSEDAPLGFYFLRSKAADNNKIQELIHMFPPGKRRSNWLQRACKNNLLRTDSAPNLLFNIAQQSSVFGNATEALNQEYQETVKYKEFAGLSVHEHVQDHIKIQEMSKRLTKDFDPGMLGQILRQFYEVAAKKFSSYRILEEHRKVFQRPDVPLQILKTCQALITQYSCEELLKAIHAPAIPGAEKSVASKEVLLHACLTPDTLLGNKFIVDGNKKNVKKVLDTLPEITLEEIQTKYNFFHEIITKADSRLYALFQQPESVFGIFSINSGMMREIFETEIRLSSKLQALGSVQTNLCKHSVFPPKKVHKQEDLFLQEWSLLDTKPGNRKGDSPINPDATFI